MKISEQVCIIINKDLLRNYTSVLHSKSYHNLSYFISLVHYVGRMAVWEDFPF